MSFKSAITSALLLAGAALPPAHAGSWPQFGYDAAHSGHNTDASGINPTTVANLALAYPQAIALTAKVDSAPVYAGGVATSQGTKNLLLTFGTSNLSDNGTSMMGTLMAIDADSGDVLWSKSGTGSSQHASSSPAVDAAGTFVYSFGVDGYIHKYQLADGTEVETAGPAGWPQRVTLKPNVEKVASGLTIASVGGTDYLEVVTDGYNGDGGDYQGHLVSIDLASGAQTVFNFMCSNVTSLLASGGCPSGRMSGAWGRGGATFDASTGRIYVTTGNGHFDADEGSHNWGDSVLAFAANGAGLSAGLPKDSYTPANADALENADADLGSVSLALLPVPAGSTVAHLGLQTGKDGMLRLIDLDDMSGAGAPAHLGGELQLIPVPQGGGVRAQQPAVWTNGADGSIWVYVGNGSGLSALQVTLDANDRPQLEQRWTQTGSASSPAIVNGVMFVAGACAAGKCVVARDPVTGAVLWTSQPIGSLHWQSPIVVDDAVYVIDSTSKLWKFVLPSSDAIFANGFDG